MPHQLTNQDTGRIVKTYKSYTNLNIRFFGIVCREDVSMARRFVESTKKSAEILWSVIFSDVSFESCLVELELAHVLCRGRAIGFFFSSSIMSKQAWEAYFFHFTKNREMVHLSFYGMTRDTHFLEVLMEFLPRMSVKTLTLCCTNIMHVGDRLLRCLCMTLEELMITGCNLIGGASLLDFGSIFGGNKGLRLKVLELGLFCTEDMANFLPGLLNECPNLRSVSISPGPQRVWDFQDSIVERSIVSHTSIKSINGCMDPVVLHKLHRMIVDERRRAWRSMMAFLNRKLARVATKCATRHLFPDADGLIWSFLV